MLLCWGLQRARGRFLLRDPYYSLGKLNMVFSLKQIHQHDDEGRQQSSGPIAHAPDSGSSLKSTVLPQQRDRLPLNGTPIGSSVRH